MVKKLLILLFISIPATADIFITKCGTRGLGKETLTSDWRSGQRVDIVDDNFPLSNHTLTHFRCVKVNKHYTKAERESILSEVYDGIPVPYPAESLEKGYTMKRIARRKEYVLPEDYPTIAEMKPAEKEKAIEEWYAKDKPYPVTDLTAYDTRDFVAVKSTTSLTVSTYDKGGSISSGTYTIGPGQDYATIATWEADMAATLTGDITGIINTNYNETTQVVFTGVNTAGYTVTLQTALANRHNGKWDGTKSSTTVDTKGTEAIIYNISPGAGQGVKYVFDGMQILNGCKRGIVILDAVGIATVTVRNCLIYDYSLVRTTDGMTAITNRNTTASRNAGCVMIVENCFISGEGYVTAGTNTLGFYFSKTAAAAGMLFKAYNCTVSSVTIGFYQDGTALAGDLTCLNTVFQNHENLSLNFNTTIAQLGGYNTIQKADTLHAIGAIMSFLSTATITAVNLGNINPLTADPRLLVGDTVAKDTGSTYAGFNRDYILSSRPQNGTWDRGCHEFYTYVQRRRRSTMDGI